MTAATAYIGLGSNLNQPLQLVTRAIASLKSWEAIEVIQVSPWYQSRAIGPGQQDDYINGAAEIRTHLTPLALLDALQTIEHQHHRQRLEHWGPRTLDLDLLLYNQLCLNHPRLTLPHPYLTQRNFVVTPLYTIAPHLVLPDGQSLALLHQHMSQEGLWRYSE